MQRDRIPTHGQKMIPIANGHKKSQSVGRKVNMNSLSLLEQNMGTVASNLHNSSQQIQLSNQKYFSNGNGPSLASQKKSASVKASLNMAGAPPDKLNYRTTNYGNFDGGATQTISGIYAQNAQHNPMLPQQLPASMGIPVHQMSSSRKGQRIQINMKNQRFQQRKASLPASKAPGQAQTLPVQLQTHNIGQNQQFVHASGFNSNSSKVQAAQRGSPHVADRHQYHRPASRSSQNGQPGNGQFRSTFFHPTSSEPIEQSAVAQLSQVYLQKDTKATLGSSEYHKKSQSMNRINQPQNAPHGYSVERLGSLSVSASQGMTP